MITEQTARVLRILAAQPDGWEKSSDILKAYAPGQWTIDIVDTGLIKPLGLGMEITGKGYRALAEYEHALANDRIDRLERDMRALRDRFDGPMEQSSGSHSDDRIWEGSGVHVSYKDRKACFHVPTEVTDLDRLSMMRLGEWLLEKAGEKS